MLALPDGLHVAAIDADFLRNGVRVLVEGDSLDVVPAGYEPPRLDLAEVGTPSVLATLAEVRCWNVGGGDVAHEVSCPLGNCSWSKDWNRPVALTVMLEAVQQHLAEGHGK
jgi:hypothetical protein